MVKRAKGRPLTRDDLDQWAELQRRLKEPPAAPPTPSPDTTTAARPPPAPSFFPLDHGYNYLLQETKPAFTFQVYGALLESGAQGLCITHTYPKKVRAMYGLSRGQVFWLSDWYGASADFLHIGSDERTLRPTRLDFEVMKEVAGFLKNGPPTVLLLDGVESLVMANGFEKVSSFLVNITHMASANQGTLLIPVDPGVFEERNRQVLVKIFDKVLDFRLLSEASYPETLAALIPHRPQRPAPANAPGGQPHDPRRPGMPP